MATRLNHFLVFLYIWQGLNPHTTSAIKIQHIQNIIIIIVLLKRTIH